MLSRLTEYGIAHGYHKKMQQMAKNDGPIATWHAHIAKLKREHPMRYGTTASNDDQLIQLVQLVILKNKLIKAKSLKYWLIVFIFIFISFKKAKRKNSLT